MEIVKSNYAISKPVKRYSEIRKEAEEMKRLVDTSKFKGYYEAAYAISHCQVSDRPYAFFVVPEYFTKKERLFKHRVFINLQILEAPLYLKQATIAGQGDINAPNSADTEEACMSFPFRMAKKVVRYDKIRVRYQVPVLGGLFMRTITQWATGLLSQIYQHEYEHALGNNIYFKTETPREWWGYCQCLNPSIQVRHKLKGDEAVGTRYCGSCGKDLE